MFTGIIEETGSVLAFEERSSAWRLQLSAEAALADLAHGDSIAVNGCCLTAVDFDDTSVSFDLLQESVRLTSFRSCEAGQRVNLERSLRFGGKVGGHFVTGHIDTTGLVEVAEYRGKDLYLKLGFPPEFDPLIAYKGSIAINGVSLTVAEVHPNGLAVWLIPHTLKLTNLGDLRPGSIVNLEFDLLAKSVQRLLPGNRPIERSDASE